MQVRLVDLLDGKFRFYLDDEYRKNIFIEQKQECKDWRILSKVLEIGTRNLFGIKRGWEYRDGIKKDYMISSKWLSLIINKFNLNIEDVEKNIVAIKLGYSGKRSKLRLPLSVDINKEPIHTIQRALIEHLYINKYKREINFNILPKDFKKEGYYIAFNTNNKNKLKIVPDKILFDERFAKEFGKWLGDRCGGARRVGVCNKEFEFVKEFKEFLIDILKQKDVRIILRCKNGFVPDKNLKDNVDKIEFSTSQYGDYAYIVGIPNRELKELVFDRLENNIFNVLYNSKKEVRYAFYAGLIEAEGSVDLRSKIITISFGFSLKKKRENNDYLKLLEKVIKFQYLLEKDGFNPRISRKIGKLSTLKYDIILLQSSKTREQEVNFIKDSIIKFLTHRKKLDKFRILERDVKGN